MRPLSVYSKYAYYLAKFGTPKRIGNIMHNRMEYRKKRIELKSRPYKITIDPGNFCNLRCPGCHTGIRHPEMIRPSFLKFTDYKVILGQVKDHALSVALYNWGEPFLNKEIFDIIHHTSENRLGTTIHSNFNRFTESMAVNAVKSGLTHIYLSIDGATQAAYEKYRVRGNIENVLDNVKTMLETRRRMNSKYPLITWKFLVFDHNKHEVDKAAQMARDIGVDAFEVFTAHPKLMDIYDEAENYRKDPVLLQNLQGHCKSLWASLYVNPDGSVLPCSLSYRDNERFGNLIHEDLDTIWNNTSFTNARKMFTSDIPPSEIPLPCRHCKYSLNNQCTLTPRPASFVKQAG